MLGQIFEVGYEVNVSYVIYDFFFGLIYLGYYNLFDGSECIFYDISGIFKYFLKVGCVVCVDC